MRVQCDQCGSSYTLPPERVVAGRRLQFQCRHCQHRIVIQVPDAAMATQAAAPVPAAVPSARVLWFVSSPAGQQQRMDFEGVKAAVADGSLTRDTWVWRKGMAEWLRAGECPDMQGMFTSRAPLPATPADDAEATLAPASIVEPTSAVAAHAAAPAGVHANEPQPTLAGGAMANVVELSRPAVVTGSHVAGTASIHLGAGHNTDQRAIAMPVIRVDAAPVDEPVRNKPMPRPRAAEPQAPEQKSRPGAAVLTPVGGSDKGAGLRKRPTAEVSPLSGDKQRANPAGARSEDDDDKGKWSPATDTYTGLRARMTRKVDEGQRNAAVEWADALNKREAEVEALVEQLKAWRRLALAAVVTLAIVVVLAILVTVKWRNTANQLEKLTPAAQTEIP